MSAVCPICRRAANPPYAPFCSKRCSDVDLQRWLSGRYVLPADEDEATEGRGEEGEGGAAPGQDQDPPL
jgi:hypothetical protein